MTAIRKRAVARREFITKGARLGFAAGLAMFHAGCGGTEPSVFTCTDTSGLTPSELKARDALKYVEQSPDPSKTCKNCQLFVKPEQPARCGGCTLAKGPYHPDGYCIAWVGLTS